MNKSKKELDQEEGPILYAQVDMTKKKGGKQAENEGPVLYAEVNKKKDKGKKNKYEEGPALYAEVDKKKNKKDKKDKKKGKKSKQEPQLEGELGLLDLISVLVQVHWFMLHRVSLYCPILVTAPISVATSGHMAKPLCHT